MRTLLLLVAAIVGALLSPAATFTVINTNDSGAGSFRRAIEDANAAFGSHAILFNIPGSGVQTIAPATSYQDISNRVTIDGYTQPGARPNSLTNGSDARLLIRLDGWITSNTSPALTLRGGLCTVRGLILVRFNAGIEINSSGGNVIAGNWIGMDADGISRGMTFEGIRITHGFGSAMNNTIGGSTPADRNVISGNWRGVTLTPWGASFNTIAGNYIGTDPSGTLPRGNIFDAVEISSATNNTVLNNLLCAGIGAGACGVSISSSSGNVIQGNMIGTDPSGLYDLGNLARGVDLASCKNIRIVGNHICNNSQDGIYMANCSATVVEGNIIGTDATGTRPMGNAWTGITLSGMGTNRIGGLTPSAGNVIQYNGRAGIAVTMGTRHNISGNSIWDNAGLGIDLGTEGVTPNDPGDVDTGPNELQNYPVLNSAMAAYGSTTVQGSLNSAPAKMYRLEFFASRAWDPFYLPEGQLFLGTASTTTDLSGNATFSVLLSTDAAGYDRVTATATDPDGNTSEFSQPAPLILGPQNVSLSIARNGAMETLSWPSQATTYVLESAISLTAPVNWQPITNGVSDDGTLRTFVVTNAPAPAAKFFRLRKN